MYLRISYLIFIAIIKVVFSEYLNNNLSYLCQLRIDVIKNWHFNKVIGV